MDIPIIQIGNSKGIRLSKMLLDKYAIRDKVELILKSGYIVIKPKAEPRKGWEKSFKKMNQAGDDKLLMNDVFPDENFKDWK